MSQDCGQREIIAHPKPGSALPSPTPNLKYNVNITFQTL